MNNSIHIPGPCSEKWGAMKTVGNKQRHCLVCKQNVYDFSKNSLNEINRKIISANGEKLCGHYHERHVSNEKTIYVLTNYIDNTFSRTRLKHFSLIIISMILLLSGCARRKLSGAYSTNGTQKSKHTHSEQIKI
jgi:hypothetical protein